MRNATLDDLPDLPTVEEAGQVLRCCRAKVFRLILAGVLVRGPRYGKRSTVTRESVLAALEAAPVEHSAPKKRIRRARGSFSARIDEVGANARAALKASSVFENSQP